jgi:hypothetical protein
MNGAFGEKPLLLLSSPWLPPPLSSNFKITGRARSHLGSQTFQIAFDNSIYYLLEDILLFSLLALEELASKSPAARRVAEGDNTDQHSDAF